MYLWKTDLLVKDFKEGKVSQLEQMKYLLAYTLLVYLSLELFFLSWSDVAVPYGIVDAASGILGIGIAVAGILGCYLINREADNRDFILRMMCLGIPILFRIVVIIAIPASLLAAIVEAIIRGPELLETGELHPAGGLVLDVVITTAYYAYLAMKIRKVSAKAEEQPSPTADI